MRQPCSRSERRLAQGGEIARCLRHCQLVEELSRGAGHFIEIVIDGLTPQAVADAMAAGLAAIVKLGPRRGAVRVGAGNYGGKLGPHHFHLKDLLP